MDIEDWWAMESNWYHADKAVEEIEAEIKVLRRVDALLEGLISAEAHEVIHEEIQALKDRAEDISLAAWPPTQSY